MSSQVTEPGKYLARARGPECVQFGVAKTGTEQIAIEFDVLDPETHNPTGATMQWIGSFANEKSMEITAKALRACGWQGDDIEDMRGIDANVVELDVQWDTYDGKQRLRVKWVNRPGGGLVFKDKLDGGKKKAVSARLRGFLAREDQKAPPALGKTGTDDDPFDFPPKK